MAKKVVKKNNLNAEEKMALFINRMDKYIEMKGNDYFEYLNEKEEIIGNLFDNIDSIQYIDNKLFNYINKKDDQFLFELFTTFDTCTDDSLYFIRSLFNIFGEKKIELYSEPDTVKNMAETTSFEFDYDMYPNLNKISFLANLNDLIANNEKISFDKYVILNLDTLLNDIRCGHTIDNNNINEFIHLDTIVSCDTNISHRNENSYKHILEVLEKIFKYFKCLTYNMNNGRNIKCLLKTDEYFDFLDKFNFDER